MLMLPRREALLSAKIGFSHPTTNQPSNITPPDILILKNITLLGKKVVCTRSNLTFNKDNNIVL